MWAFQNDHFYIFFVRMIIFLVTWNVFQRVLPFLPLHSTLPASIISGVWRGSGSDARPLSSELSQSHAICHGPTTDWVTTFTKQPAAIFGCVFPSMLGEMNTQQRAKWYVSFGLTLSKVASCIVLPDLHCLITPIFTFPFSLPNPNSLLCVHGRPHSSWQKTQDISMCKLFLRKPFNKCESTLKFRINGIRAAWEQRTINRTLLLQKVNLLCASHRLELESEWINTQEMVPKQQCNG